MASLLGEVLFEADGQGTAPCKDFYQIIITHNEVIWRWWKISIRSEFRGTPPGEIKQSYNDFLQDDRLQEQVGVVFGPRTLEYILALCQGHINYLDRLPDQLLLKTLSYLSWPDTGHLSQTSSRFRKLCNSEDFWKQMILRHCDMITEDMEMLAKGMGWKNIFFKFYCNEEEHGSTAHPAEEDKPSTATSP
ncbi:F-box only protein 36a [Xyrauchen texanus]|uniref:F-box only protein 36a n=1 Tax=Xyrauchen texanus TaxID=154827 RepID=UPI0022429D71|nr:F-box only protein 36a [Xyrauchen texanus]